MLNRRSGKTLFRKLWAKC